MTQIEVAAHLDISPRNLSDVLKMLGLPSKNIDLDQTRIACIRHLRSIASRHPVQLGKPSTGGLNLTQERAGLVAAQRQVAELQLAQTKRILLDAATVAKDAFDMARRTRDRIFGVAPRVAARLADETDIKTIEKILLDELRIAMTELASETD
ncbi:MAG: hypothetical protein H7839_23390 [Magnetococcus sp. YQC-5]